VTVQLLDAQPCATPANVNPYASYAGGAITTQQTAPVSQIMVASALVPVGGGQSVSVQTQATQELDMPSMEHILVALSGSINIALLEELGRLSDE